MKFFKLIFNSKSSSQLQIEEMPKNRDDDNSTARLSKENSARRPEAEVITQSKSLTVEEDLEMQEQEYNIKPLIFQQSGGISVQEIEKEAKALKLIVAGKRDLIAQLKKN
jgi:hypothetical protein